MKSISSLFAIFLSFFYLAESSATGFGRQIFSYYYCEGFEPLSRSERGQIRSLTKNLDPRNIALTVAHGAIPKPNDDSLIVDLQYVLRPSGDGTSYEVIRIRSKEKIVLNRDPSLNIIGLDTPGLITPSLSAFKSGEAIPAEFISRPALNPASQITAFVSPDLTFLVSIGPGIGLSFCINFDNDNGRDDRRRTPSPAPTPLPSGSRDPVDDGGVLMAHSAHEAILTEIAQAVHQNRIQIYGSATVGAGLPLLTLLSRLAARLTPQGTAAALLPPGSYSNLSETLNGRQIVVSASASYSPADIAAFHSLSAANRAARLATDPEFARYLRETIEAVALQQFIQNGGA